MAEQKGLLAGTGFAYPAGELLFGEISEVENLNGRLVLSGEGALRCG